MVHWFFFIISNVRACGTGGCFSKDQRQTAQLIAQETIVLCQPDFLEPSKCPDQQFSSFLKLFQSFSLDFFCFFPHLQSLFLSIFRGMCFFFVKPLNSDL